MNDEYPDLNKKWQLLPSNIYKLIRKVGTGSFGEVIKVLHIPSNKHVAIKLLTNLFENTY